MGNLKSIVIQREPVMLQDGQSFDVRAVSTNDLMSLVGEHGAGLTMVFAKLQAEKGEGGFDGDTIRETIFKVAREFPDIAAALIALASDAYDKEGRQLAKELPFPTQVEALETIFGLTFRSEGAVKKLMETLTGAMTALAGALAETSSLPNGIGVSDGSATFS